MAGHIVMHLLEKACGEHKIVEGFVAGIVYVAHVAHPFPVALVYEYDVLPDTEYAIHVVSIDNGGYPVLMSDVAQQLVDED